MNFFIISNNDLEDIAEYKGVAPESMLQKSVADVLQLRKDVNRAKAHDAALRNAADENYIHFVKTYFTPFEMLRKYFSEEEIITACANHIPLTKLIDELPIPCDSYHNSVFPKDYKPYGEKSEYLREDWATLPRYAKNPAGEQLLIGERKKCYIYAVTARCQGTRHGDVILELLYNAHPELKEFEFGAYEYCDYNQLPYEIYPKNDIYTPFEALMNKDIDAIKKRALDYAKSYNHGEYTVEKVQKKLLTDEVKHFFNVIQSM